LKQLAFEGPYSGGKHQFMVKDDITVRLPNPHQGDIGQEFLARILRQARIDREQWEIL
jgi:predicted RNA binding protein YcfA (HicA-like mRNA interferase family)